MYSEPFPSALPPVCPPDAFLNATGPGEQA